MEFLNKYFSFLMACFEYDVAVFSNMWMYIPLLVPASCYLMFFFVKWITLLFPVWLPFAAVGVAIRRVVKR